ncbi:MAG: hypothetical protein ACOYXR_08370 [Nitrospirota bacterium]
MSDHQSFLKDKADCGCGCGLYGTLKKPNRAGVQCVRGCKACPSCRGLANKRKGQKKQAKAVTALGIPRSSIHPGHEEFLPGQLRVEVKAGAQIKPAVTAYLKCEAQSEAQRPIGDHRPFAAVMMPDGSSDGLVVVRLSNLHEFVAAVTENWGAA